MFSNRQLELLKFIMNNPQGVFGSKIAEIFSLSSRTIRTEIKAINKKETIILSNQKIGYFIADEQLEKVRKILSRQQTGMSSDENEKRLFELLGVLAFHESIDLFDLCEEVHFSEQTVRSDLGKLQKLIDETEVPVQIKLRGNLIALGYDEWAVRKLYHKIFIKYIYTHGNTVLKELLYQHFNAEEYNDLFYLLRDYFKHSDIFLTDDELIMMVDAIYVCIVRNNCGYPTEKQTSTASFSKEIEKLLKFILDNKLNITFNDYDNLGRFFSTMKITKNTADEISNFTLFIFEELCAEVLDKYCLDLKITEEFIQKFLVHLEYMLRRIENQEQVSNPMLNEMKYEFPYAYEISMLLVHICYKYLNQYISDDEVAFVALYIAHYLKNIYKKLQVVLVVSSRKSLVSITENWLEAHFHRNIEIIQLLPAYMLEEYLEERKVDLIISTTGNVIHPKIPVFQMRGIPSDRDEEALNSLIKKMRETSRYKELIRNIFQDDLVFIHEEEQSFERIISELSRALEQGGKIKDQHVFAKDILRREENYPTHLNDVFMIPHPLTSFAEHSGIAAAVLKKPLQIHGQNIRIIFAIAIEQKQNSDIGVLFEFFRSLAKERDALQRIIQITSGQEFLDIMTEMTSLMN